MGTGTMIHSIFGFCDVRQFTDTTECLQEEVMLFVNRIAHILHSIIVQCAGSANKNIGDAFLLTWKLDDKLTPEKISLLADQALVAFCKTLVELGRYQDFICNFSVAATARLYKRFPGYLVRIGSGLHVGWAIEGAIGSNRKIDASYLSPHVNFTEYLESSTKAYGVPLLLSEPFFKMLSPAAAKFCRQVDRIRKNDRDEPMGLYTYDSDLSIDWSDVNRKTDGVVRAGGAHVSSPPPVSLPVAPAPIGAPPPTKSPAGKRRNSTVGASKVSPLEALAAKKAQEEAELEAALKEKNDAELSKPPTIIVPPYTQDVWEEDDELIELRHRVSDAMRELWGRGIKEYIKGDWPKARDIFQETLKMSGGKDGPSLVLIAVMDEHGGGAPSDWHGYRDESEGGH